jgi:hypothetical protein
VTRHEGYDQIENALLRRKDVRHYGQTDIRPASHARYDPFDILAGANDGREGLDRSGSRGNLKRSSVIIGLWSRVRIEQKPGARDARRDFLQQLDPLAAE